MAHVQPVRARIPRRREVRARVGVLEDVRGPAGDGFARCMAMTVLGNGLSAAAHDEDALSVKETELSIRGALAYQNTYSFSAGQSCEHVSKARTVRQASQMIAMYTPDV